MTTNGGVRSGVRGAKGGQSVLEKKNKNVFPRNLGTTDDEDDRRTRHRRLFRSLGTNARVEAPRARRGTHLPVLVVRPVLFRRSNPTHVRRGRGRGAHPPRPPRTLARPVGQQCRFLGPNGTRDSSWRDAPREARRARAARRAFARAPRLVATAPRAERDPGTRGAGGTGRCAGFATCSSLFLFATTFVQRARTKKSLRASSSVRFGISPAESAIFLFDADLLDLLI